MENTSIGVMLPNSIAGLANNVYEARLMGDHEILYEPDPDQAIKRAEELVENIQTVLIPNASHMVLLEQTELVNSHILNFLSGDKQTGQ